MSYNGEDMVGMSHEDMLKQDVKILCEKILGTHYSCLTKEEWQGIESRAFEIAHDPDILNA